MKGSYNAYEHWQRSQRQHSYPLHAHGTYIHYLAQNPVLQKPYQLPLDHGYAVSPSSDRVCSVHTSRCHTSPDNTQAASANESLPHRSLHECSFPLIRFSVFLLLLNRISIFMSPLIKRKMNINFTLLGVTQSVHSSYPLRINTQTMPYNAWRHPLTSPYSTVTDLARFLG